MNIEDIKELAGIMKDNGMARLEFVQGEDRLLLERESSLDQAAIGIIGSADGPTSIYVNQEERVNHSSEIFPVQAEQEGTAVVSPMVGVFYAAASPEGEPYVQVGDQVKKGDVLCIIEAMKLMNEIQAEVDGTIAVINVGNGQVVEFDQPLFWIV